MAAKATYDLAHVAREMKLAHDELTLLSEPHWTPEEMVRLYEVRHQALRLAEVAYQLIEDARLTG